MLSGVSSQSVNSVFSATYLNYLITLKNSPIGSTGLFHLRLRASGSDSSASYGFYVRRYNYANTTDVLFSSASGSECRLGNANGAETSATIFITNPNVAVPTSFITATTTSDLTTQGGCYHNVSTSYDGFTLTFPSNSNGEVSVYGYNK